MKKTQTKMNKELDSTKLINQMIKWSIECGEILNSHLIKSYTTPLKFIDKGSQGLATEADVISEAHVIEQIRKKFPTHKILSEEDAFSRELKIEGVNKDEYLWLIDPLDGTNNFFNRVPFFAVSLALTKGDKTIAGVVYNPVSFELFYATKGGGAYLVRSIGGRKIKIKLKASRKKKNFHEALLSANLTRKSVEKNLLKSFPEVRAMRRLGSAALEMSYVAAGMLDAYWEYKLKPWDMAAAGLICEEAGVKISDIRGEKYHPFCESVLVSTPTLYKSLQEILGSK